jgi:hypothetical protein
VHLPKESECRNAKGDCIFKQSPSVVDFPKGASPSVSASLQRVGSAETSYLRGFDQQHVCFESPSHQVDIVSFIRESGSLRSDDL